MPPSRPSLLSTVYNINLFLLLSLIAYEAKGPKAPELQKTAPNAALRQHFTNQT